LVRAIRNLLSKRRNQRYKNQGDKEIQIGGFGLVAPIKHPIDRWLEAQPFRDLNIGISSKYIAEKYPSSIIVDIGANIGDTAAIISANTNNDMILVEPSKYFFEYLKTNTRGFSNKIDLVNGVVSGKKKISGTLIHRGGTAEINEGNRGELDEVENFTLQQLCKGKDIGLIKIDTDGFDFEILMQSKKYLSEITRPILFENQIRTADDRKKADDLYEMLMEIGYRHFIVWDAPGFLLIPTKSLEILKDLNRYQYSIWQASFRKSINNYDVLCLSDLDEDLFIKIVDYYRN
jgi:FkbM family methyltransferase